MTFFIFFDWTLAITIWPLLPVEIAMVLASMHVTSKAKDGATEISTYSAIAIEDNNPLVISTIYKYKFAVG